MYKAVNFSPLLYAMEVRAKLCGLSQDMGKSLNIRHDLEKHDKGINIQYKMYSINLRANYRIEVVIR